MNGRVLVFGTSIELLTSLWLYGRAPTDGVRAWYPSAWAYMGEHGLVWGIIVAILFAIFTKRTINEPLTALICLVTELASTLYVWFVIPWRVRYPERGTQGRFRGLFRYKIDDMERPSGRGLTCLLASIQARFETIPSARLSNAPWKITYN